MATSSSTTAPAPSLPSQPQYNSLPMPMRRELLWLEGGKKCHWCGCATYLKNDNAWDKATVDHVIPRYKGGSNDPDNLVSACNRCNNRRNWEDQRGIRDGSSLGQYKQHDPMPPTSAAKGGRVALTGDEKRAIKVKKSTEEVLREQRDQAMQQIDTLRQQKEDTENKLVVAEKEIAYLQETVRKQREQMKKPTLWKSLRKGLASWIEPKDLT